MSKTAEKQKDNNYRWEVLGELNNTKKDIYDVLLEIRGLTTKKEKDLFFNPPHPNDLQLKDVGIDRSAIDKSVKRIKDAFKKGERVVVYGDYDADGICASAIMWETLHSLNEKVLPHIPNRFSEGYGINAESVELLKEKYPDLGLIITVDNGIVAEAAVKRASELGIDVIITDHHEKGLVEPSAYSIVHSTSTSGSGVAWFFVREVRLAFNINEELPLGNGLELAAIGTIADQINLLGVNRSIVKYGLSELNRTKRPGIKCLLEDAGIEKSIGVYAVGFVIAPRINAMGRLEHALDSLRFLCTKNDLNAKTLSRLLEETNRERQKIVEDVVVRAKEQALKSKCKGVILVADKTYHEGIIGLAASKIVEEFYRPVIVISQSEEVSKASARSIPGFNIIENIRKLETFLVNGGGHPMAAGFSIETKRIVSFTKELEKLSAPLLTEDILRKRLRIDLNLEFDQIDKDVLAKLKEFEPTGLGNPTPTFVTHRVNVLDSRAVGRDLKHLKLVVEKEGKVFDAIGFNLGPRFPLFDPSTTVDIVYTLDENEWRGNKTIQLKLKDLALN